MGPGSKIVGNSSAIDELFMPMQSTAERLLASLQSLLSGVIPPGAKVLRNPILPDKAPAAWVVILREGDPRPPEVWLTPPGSCYKHRAGIRVVVDGTPARPRCGL